MILEGGQNRLSENANNTQGSHPDESRDPSIIMTFKEFLDTGLPVCPRIQESPSGRPRPPTICAWTQGGRGRPPGQFPVFPQFSDRLLRRYESILVIYPILGKTEKSVVEEDKTSIFLP